MGTNGQVTAGWLSRNTLDRHRPFLIVIELQLFTIGCLFWVDSYGSSSQLTPETWGSLAYMFPADMWAFCAMFCSAVLINGLMKPIKGRMVVLGSAVSCIQFIVLSYSAAFTGGEVVIGLYASVFFLPIHIWILIEAAGRAK